MKRNTKAIVAGVVTVGFVAFFFLAPVFYWFTASGPIITPNGNRTTYYIAYRSLGCEYLGLGDTYYAAGATPVSGGSSIYGVMFTCTAPEVAVAVFP